ncbi:MAG: LysR family transcriptional regulator [Sphaerobacter sp.]|nr:LysR family transcriptional regulator [Sphaerobacter sp.]
MDLTLHQLRLFREVARQGSFSRAAEALFISQPGVSGQIKALERAVGLPLFERAGRSIRLTEAGRELLGYADRVLTLLDEAQVVLQELAGVERGSVRLGASTTAGIYVAPKALGTFHRRFPGVRLALDVLNRFGVEQLLSDGEIDLAIMGKIENPKGLEVEPFLPNELVVIASPRHRLAGVRAVPAAALSEEIFLLREAGSGTRADTETLFDRWGIPLRIGMELRSTGAIKQAVAADLGVAVIPRVAIGLELQVGRLVTLDVEGFPVQRHWSLVRRSGRRPAAAAAALWDFLLHYRDSVG